MSERLVVRGGFVVSMDPEIGEMPNADILVEDGKIVEIGPKLDVGDAEEIDASGKLVLPGFIDTHRHTWQTPVRGVLPCCTLDAYFADMLGKIGLNYRPEDVYIGNYAARSRRSTPGSRRCSTGRTSRTRPSTPTRRCTGSRTPASAASTRTASRATTAGGRTATGTTPRTSGASASSTSPPTTSC